jgi:hypothetical protein
LESGGAEARKPKHRLTKVLFGVCGIGFLVVAFDETWQRSQGLPIPKPWAFVSAAALVLVGLVCLARAWTSLFQDQGKSPSLTAAFYTSQLGRYIPGVIWQVLAQVGLATEAGASLPQASTAFGVFALVEVAAGGTVGATLALFGGGMPWALRLSALLMLIPLLALRRRWIARALHIAGRLIRRELKGDFIPSQRAILHSYLFTLMTIVLNGLAFALLATSLRAGTPILRSLAAFGFAWTIGFVAIPFPSGIGVREAVLILTVGSGVPTSYIIAASVSHRLVSMVAELAMIVASRTRLRRAVRRDG